MVGNKSTIPHLLGVRKYVTQPHINKTGRLRGKKLLLEYDVQISPNELLTYLKRLFKDHKNWTYLIKTEFYLDGRTSIFAYIEFQTRIDKSYKHFDLKLKDTIVQGVYKVGVDRNLTLKYLLKFFDGDHTMEQNNLLTNVLDSDFFSKYVTQLKINKTERLRGKRLLLEYDAQISPSELLTHLKRLFKDQNNWTYVIKREFYSDGRTSIFAYIEFQTRIDKFYKHFDLKLGAMIVRGVYILGVDRNLTLKYLLKFLEGDHIMEPNNLLTNLLEIDSFTRIVVTKERFQGEGLPETPALNESIPQMSENQKLSEQQKKDIYESLTQYKSETQNMDEFLTDYIINEIKNIHPDKLPSLVFLIALLKRILE